MRSLLNRKNLEHLYQVFRPSNDAQLMAHQCFKEFEMRLTLVVYYISLMQILRMQLEENVPFNFWWYTLSNIVVVIYGLSMMCTIRYGLPYLDVIEKLNSLARLDRVTLMI